MKKLSASVLTVVLSSTFVVTNAQETKKDSVKTTKIDELVMVAYGVQKKSEVAGSITTIKAKDIEQAQTPNAVQSLTGKVGGVQISTTNGQPGSEPQVRFRGLGSLSSSNNPLYVVDGVPFNGTINSISNQDIESVTFLKDAAANALYGSRGANGVVVITTKKGKGRKLSVSFDTKVGINSRAVPEYDIITNPGEFYETYYERLKTDYLYTTPGATEVDAINYAITNLIDGERGLVYNAYNVANNQLIDPATGKIRAGASLLYNDDWQRAIFKKRIRQEHNLSISGGSDKLDAYFSLGYLNDQGYVVNSGFDRYTARLNTNFKISKNLETGVNINYARTMQDSPLAGVVSGTYSNVVSFARNIAPIFPIYARNANGSIAYDQTGRPIFDWGKADGYMGLERTPYSAGQNAYAQAFMNQRKNTTDNVSGRAYFSYNFLNGFNFRYNLGYDLLAGNYLRYGTPEGGDSRGSKGSITNVFDKSITITNQQLLSWDRKFGNHNISAMVGHETSDYSFEAVAGNKTNVVIPNLGKISNASTFGFLNNYGDKYKVEGFLSRINYSYANKYFFNASFRRDGSSIFHPDNRWGNFYGLGGAWSVSNENFLKDNKVLTNLRLKVGYGEQGNDNIVYPNYVILNHRWNYGRNFAPYKNQYEVVPDAAGNPTVLQVYEGNKDLKWEVSRNFNAGIEFSLFDRVSIDAQIFERAVSDMIYNKPLPLSTGTAFISENIGDMRNRGVEASISVDILKGEYLNWNVFGNATFYKNKITMLPSQFNSSIFMFKEGLSAYTYYLREFAGVDKTNGDALWYKDVKDASGNVVGKETTNVYTDATLYVINKNANPKVYGGFGTSFQYKNWSLGANFSYQFGGYMYDGIYAGLLSSRDSDRGSNFHRDIHKTWTHTNKDASLPAVDFTRNTNNGTSTLYLIKSDYISLEDVSLSYDVNPELLSEYGISGLKLGVYATNVALWSKRKGLDPRMMSLGDQFSSNGQTLNRYGATRTVSLGLTVKF